MSVFFYFCLKTFCADFVQTRMEPSYDIFQINWVFLWKLFWLISCKRGRDLLLTYFKYVSFLFFTFLFENCFGKFRASEDGSFFWHISSKSTFFFGRFHANEERTFFRPTSCKLTFLFENFFAWKLFWPISCKRGRNILPTYIIYIYIFFNFENFLALKLFCSISCKRGWDLLLIYIMWVNFLSFWPISNF